MGPPLYVTLIAKGFSPEEQADDESEYDVVDEEIVRKREEDAVHVRKDYSEEGIDLVFDLKN